MPVALIGTIAAIYLAGFSINILTLLALVLATGLVVDDAIVVLENIVRRRNQGMGPRAAAVLGTKRGVLRRHRDHRDARRRVHPALVPARHRPAGCSASSASCWRCRCCCRAVVALSLCPMLASRMLTGARRRVGITIDRGIGRPDRRIALARGLYRRCLHACLDAPLIVLLVLRWSSPAAAFAYVRADPAGTDADRGPRDRHAAHQPRRKASASTTPTQQIRADRAADPAAAWKPARSPAPSPVAGQGGANNSGFMVMTLAPWDERAAAQQEIVAELNRALQQVPGVPHHRRCSRTASASAAPAAACSSRWSATTTRSSATGADAASSPRWRRTRASSSRG